MQYLNKQTTALREVNDSRLRIYEQVFASHQQNYHTKILQHLYTNSFLHLFKKIVNESLLAAKYLYHISFFPKMSSLCSWRSPSPRWRKQTAGWTLALQKFTFIWLFLYFHFHLAFLDFNLILFYFYFHLIFS